MTYRRTALSLIEVFVVIAIIGVLVGLILPAVQASREAASRASCLDKMRQIGLALHDYHSVFGRLPPNTANEDRRDPNNALSWMALILPHVDQAALWSTSAAALRLEERPFVNPPHVGYATVVPLFVCSSDVRLLHPLTDDYGVTAAYTSFLGVSGSRYSDGVMGRAPGLRLNDILDGTTTTLMVGERPPPENLAAGRWYSGSSTSNWGLVRGPEEFMHVIALYNLLDTDCMAARHEYGPGRIDNPCDRYHFWSLHAGGSNWLFADASARYFSYNAVRILPALASIAGGESVRLPD